MFSLAARRHAREMSTMIASARSGFATKPSRVGAASKPSRLARAASPATSLKPRSVGLALRRSRRARAPSPPRAGDPGDDDARYYDAWAKYPDDPNVPPEITQLLREVGDGPPDMWKSKPVWCQPWTILLTGSAVVYAPTLVFHAKWASALVAVPIVAWWYLFLLVVPKQYADYVETARQYYDRR